MSDLISRADAMAEFSEWVKMANENGETPTWNDAVSLIGSLPSADAEPKWNCTANFVAEQLDRLRKMTDEEKWEFFKRFFEIKGGDDE